MKSKQTNERKMNFQKTKKYGLEQPEKTTKERQPEKKLSTFPPTDLTDRMDLEPTSHPQI